MKSHVSIWTIYQSLLATCTVLVALTLQSCGGSPSGQDQSTGPSMLKSRGAEQDTSSTAGQDTTSSQTSASQTSASQTSASQTSAGETATTTAAERPAKLPRGALFAEADAEQKAEQQQQQEQQPQASKRVTTETGLQYEDMVVGNGPQPQGGQTVTVHYTGWLTNGTKFDSSVDKGQPFQFVLGAREVIRGWDEGVATMRVGGKRRLFVPPDLGYGDRGAGGVIPPGATLVFDVELLGIQ